MDKRIKTILILILMFCVTALTCLLWGCTSGKGTSEPGGTEPNDSPPPSSDVLRISLEQLAGMKIIYSQNASEELIAAAKTLQTAIRSSYGVELMATSDYLRENSSLFSEAEYEILIGDTARPASGEILNNLRYEDYGYGMTGTKIVIKGGNPKQTVDAVSAFAYDVVVLKKGGDSLFYSGEWDDVTEKSYPARTLTLNGNSLFDYRIVYPENGTTFEAELASMLADRLRLLSGVTLAVCSDAQPYADGYEILIGDTNRSVQSGNGATVTVSGKLLSLRGDHAAGHGQAVKYLLAAIEETAQGGMCALQWEGNRQVEPSGTVSSMTYNVYGFNVTEPRTSNVCSLVLRYLPDIVCLQETANDWMQVFNGTFSEYYGTVLGLARHGDQTVSGAYGANTYLPILYAKDRFRVIESGTRWLTHTPDEVSLLPGAQYYRTFTWAVLEDLHSGEQLLVVNNHLDTASDFVRLQELRLLFAYLETAYKDIAVLFAGDMNCADGSEPIAALREVGLLSADSYEGFVSSGTGSIDWIFVTPDCMQVTAYRVCDDRFNGTMPSDHPAVYAEFAVSYPEGGVSHSWVIGGTTGGIEMKPDTETDFGGIHPLF